MKKTITVLVLLTALTEPLLAQKSEEKLVKKTFDNYKNAILNHKGEEAATYVDAHTIKYYGDVLGWVRNSDSSQVAALPLFDRFMVFALRHRATANEIKSFDGRSLLVYAIDGGMVGKNSIAKNSIGDVKIEGTTAKGQLVNNGSAMPFYIDFAKEQEQWKIDLTSIFSVSGKGFQMLASQSGKDENAFLFSLLELVTARVPGREIWQPVK